MFLSSQIYDSIWCMVFLKALSQFEHDLKLQNIPATSKIRFRFLVVAEIIVYDEVLIRNSHDLKRPLCDSHAFNLAIYLTRTSICNFLINECEYYKIATFARVIRWSDDWIYTDWTWCARAMVWIAFGCVWIVCMSTILRRPSATTKTYAKNAKHRAPYARARSKLKHSDCKVL